LDVGCFSVFPFPGSVFAETFVFAKFFTHIFAENFIFVTFRKLFSRKAERNFREYTTFSTLGVWTMAKSHKYMHIQSQVQFVERRYSAIAVVKWLRNSVFTKNTPTSFTVHYNNLALSTSYINEKPLTRIIIKQN
jgi:hypothetical protein